MRTIDCSKHDLKEIADPTYFIQLSERAKKALSYGYDINQENWESTYRQLKALVLLGGISSLEELKKTTVLDLGCGQVSGIDSYGVKDTRFEPWLCRALHLLGAKAIGVDIGKLTAEGFEHHRRDLLDIEPLEGIADSSIDLVYTCDFFNSPFIHDRYGSDILFLLKLNLFPEIRRVLKPEGVFMHYGAEERSWYYSELPDRSDSYGRRLDTLITQTFSD